MFTVTSIIGVKKGVNERWVTVPLSDYKVYELFALFRKVILTARIEMEVTDVYIDLSQFAARYADYQHSIADMFIELGNSTVNLLPFKPSIEPKHVAWNDAFRAGYVAMLWDRLNNTNTPVDERKDALITRDAVATSYRDVVDYCLTTVNGYYHYTDTNNTDGVVIYDAAECLRKARSNQIGLLSFKSIGKIKRIPITDAMILTRQTNASIQNGEVPQPFKSISYIHIPENIANKTVFLVLGGYLLTPDTGYYKQVGDSEFFIDFDKYPMLDRYYDSLDYLDLSSLEMSTGNANDTQRLLTELTSEDVLRKFLKLSQTFFVVIDSPDIYVQTMKLQQVVSSGIFRMFKDSNLPMMLSNGRMPEYWKTKYDSVITLTVDKGWVERRVFNKAREGSLQTVVSTGLSNGYRKPADGFLMEIGVDYKETAI